MFNKKQELLKNYLSKHPSDAPEFLSIVSEALKNYEESVKKQRNYLASNAILYTMGYTISSKRITDKKMYDSKMIFMSLFDSMFLSFPDPTDLTHASILMDGLDVFVKSCEEENVLTSDSWSNWLKDVAGSEKTKWLTELIENYKT